VTIFIFAIYIEIKELLNLEYILFVDIIHETLLFQKLILTILLGNRFE